MAYLWKVVTKITGPAGAPWYNSLFFHSSVGSPNGAATAAYNLWHGFKDYMHSTATFTTPTEVLVVESSNGKTQGIEPVTSHTENGIVSNDLLPRGTQAKMVFRTGEFPFNREVKGAVYIPALCENKNSASGEVDSATVTALNVIGQALCDDASVLFGIYSPTHRVFYNAATASTHNEWSVLRTRRD